MFHLRKKNINSFFRSHQIKESLCLRVVLWMIKICDFLSPFSIPIGWKVISNYFLWLFITTHPQSGPTWASVFSAQSCAILPIYRYWVVICVFKQGCTLGKISSLFKKDLEMIILRNNIHGGIIRVCMGIITTALRNKKNTSNSQKKISPYFHNVLLVIWLPTLMKRTHFSELSFSRLSTYIRKAQGWTLHFRTLDLRGEKFQRKMTGRPQIQCRIQTHIL